MSGKRRRVTVCWHPAAEEDLAGLWQASGDSGALERAANEIDPLLRVSPSEKGAPYALATLSEDQSELLLKRTGALPEGLRSLRCGPVQVYFTPHEEDGQARVWMVMLRPT